MITETNLFPAPVPQSDAYGITRVYGTGTPASGSYRIVKDSTTNAPLVRLNNPAQPILGKATTVALKVRDVSGKGCVVRISGDYFLPDGNYDTWSPHFGEWIIRANETRTILTSFPNKDAALHFRPLVTVKPLTSDPHNAMAANSGNFEDTAIPFYWSATNGANAVQSTDRAHLGTRSLKVSTVAGQRAKVVHTLSPLTGENIAWDFCAFTFSAHVSAATAINGKYDILATWYDENWNWLGDGFESMTKDALAGLGSSWRRIKHSFVVQPQARHIDISIQAQANLTAGETWYLDSARIEQGEYARQPVITRADLAVGDGIEILEIGILQDTAALTGGVPVVGKPGCRWAGTPHRSSTVRKTTIVLTERDGKAQPSWLRSRGTSGEVLLRDVGPVALPPRFTDPPHPMDNTSSPWRMKASTWLPHPNTANIVNYVASQMNGGNNAFVECNSADVETERKWARVSYRATTSDPIVTLSTDSRYSHPWLDSRFVNEGFHLPADALPHPNSDSALTVTQPDGSIVWLWQFFRTTMTCSSAYWIYPDTTGVGADQPGGDPRNIGYKHPHCQGASWYDMAKGVIDRSIIGFLPAAAHSATRIEYPAAVRDGSGTDPNVMVVGWRLCIKASVDLDALNLHPSALVVARMLQDYGTTITDTNSPVSGLGVHLESRLAPSYDEPPYYLPPALFSALPISSAMWEVRYHPQANP